MWLNFLLSALIVAFFVGRMAMALRARELELARAREAALRNEQILALGTLAAGAAHQLGTPLSTMAVVVRELELQHGGNLELAADLSVMRQQIDNCKAILSQLVAAAGHSRGEGGEGIALDAYLDRIIDEWRVLRPAAKVATYLQAARAAPRILADRTLEYAVLNLLNNAADASPDGVEVRGTWDDRQCTVDILDRGPGLDAGAAQRIGQPFYTTKTDRGGMGIGVFLSNATVERYGGKVELTNREGGGARTRIHLPLTRLLVEQ
jgi:two-component system sensor histidine kinase RegB